MVCPYHASGCKWEGKFGKLTDHLEECKYSVCNDCNERLSINPMEHHCMKPPISTPFNCPICHLSGFASEADLEDHHTTQHIRLNNTPLAQRFERLEAALQELHVQASSSKALASEAMIAADRQALQEEAVNKLRQDVMNLQQVIKKYNIVSLDASKPADIDDRDFRLSLIESSNHDGSMVWKIPHFSQRMGDAKSGKCTSIYSPPFYTGRHGYKMCLRLYILGDDIGKGSYMSLFFVLMKGEFDNILQWPFTHKVTFKLINQNGGRDVVDTFQPDPMSSSFRKPKSDMNIASGCPRFVPHTELKNGFTVDDTVFIKCIVDTTTIRHP